MARGRRPQVKYWDSRKAYMCWFKGKQEILAEGPKDCPNGPTYQAAVKRFADLSCFGDAERAGANNTVRLVCEKYLQHIETRRSVGTVKIRAKNLKPFVASLGEVRVRELTHQRVYDWLDTMREWRTNRGTGLPTRWQDGAIRTCCTSMIAAFNWAVRSGLLPKNPLFGLEMPGPRSRSREVLLGNSPEERRANHKRILQAATTCFRPLIVCLEATGARPSELANATAADFKPAEGVILYCANDKRLRDEFRHKTARKGKDRIIVLTGEALEIVRDLAKKYPKGPLFRTSQKENRNRGNDLNGWTDQEICNRFRAIQDVVGMKNLTAYSYRHTFATAWLEQGKSVDILAELMGNSPAVIRQHYSHLLADTDNLRRQVMDFRGVMDRQGLLSKLAALQSEMADILVKLDAPKALIGTVAGLRAALEDFKATPESSESPAVLSFAAVV